MVAVLSNQVTQSESRKIAVPDNFYTKKLYNKKNPPRLSLRYVPYSVRKVPLHKMTDQRLSYTASISLACLDECVQESVKAYAQANPAQCFDMSMTGFYFMPDWHVFSADGTSVNFEDTQQLQVLKESGEYTYSNWKTTRLQDLAQYLDVLWLSRLAKKQFGEKLVSRHRLAIRISHVV